MGREGGGGLGAGVAVELSPPGAAEAGQGQWEASAEEALVASVSCSFQLFVTYNGEVNGEG